MSEPPVQPPDGNGGERPRDRPTTEATPPPDAAHAPGPHPEPPPDRPTTEAGTPAGPGPEQPPDDVTGDGTGAEQLPFQLRGHVTDRRPLPAQGGQSRLFRATWDGDREVVIKIFNRAHDNAQRRWEMWSGATDRRHVVPLVFACTANAQDYEVTEYVAAGSLRDLMVGCPEPMDGGEVETVLREMAQALHYVHRRPQDPAGAGYWVHGDIKPANILVASVDPLRLCLTDFGIAQVLEFTHEQGPVSMDARYAAPERFRGNWSPGGDWWSLGMTLLELLQGHQPFADGLTPYGIGELVNTGPVPIDDTVPARWTPVLNGLLTRDLDRRWGHDQIQRWLSGESPPVHTPLDERVEPPGVPGDGPAGDPFVFNRQVVRRPRELADAMRGHWDEAVDVVLGWRRELLLDWAGSFSDQLRADLGPATRQRPVDRAVTEVIVALDPEGPATFRQFVVDRDGLLGLAVAAEQGDATSVEVLTSLHASEGLRILGRLRHCHDLFVIHDRWRHLCHVAQAAGARALGSPEQLPERDLLVFMTLRAALDPEYPEALANAAARVLNRSRRRVGWFCRLNETATGEDAPAYHAVMILAHPLADELPYRVSQAAQDEVRVRADQLLAEIDAEIRRGSSAQSRAERRRARRDARRGVLAQAYPPTLWERLSRASAPLVASLLYVGLTVFAGVGVGLGTSPGQGALTTGLLLLVGAWLPAAFRVRELRVAQLLVGGWAGAIVGVLLAVLVGTGVGVVLGSNAGWPAFWVTWVASIVAGATLGAAE